MPSTDNRGYPSHYESRLVLKDGREVLLRPVLPTDDDLIIDLFGRISPGSLYQRFLRKIDVLPEDLLHHFTHLNYETDFALAAVVIIAVGRYAFDPHEDSYDLALAVRDDRQNLGLGKSLLIKLVAVAKEHGISHFTSMMDTGNTVMEKILRDLGYEVKYSPRSGFYQVEIFV
jgi:acetyltransferase